MRTIIGFVCIVILFKVTHIDDLAWPIIKHLFAAVDHSIQKVN